MIRTNQLCFAYGKVPLLRDIDLDVRPGEILSIVGPNGCGKSTLLKLLRGQLAPQQGQVLWQDKQITSYSKKAFARLAAMVPQSAPVYFPYPVREMVLMGRYARQSSWWGPSRQDHQAVEHALAVTDTLHLVDRPVTDLSGGEVQRVLLARALAQETPVLLLDEATSHLDLDHRLEMAQLLTRLNREHKTTIVQVSHDLDLAAETSQRILLMNSSGAPVALGSPGEVFTVDNIRQVFRVEVQVENNPWSGAPRIYAAANTGNWEQPPRVHVICGGGSGGNLLRRLHVAGCQMSVGPLNQGDTDQELSRALNLPMITEQPFCPISDPILAAAAKLCTAADTLVIAPTVWGPGNLACLRLAEAALQRNQRLLIIDPLQERDFSAGRAWSSIQSLLDHGAEAVTDVEAVLEQLQRHKS